MAARPRTHKITIPNLYAKLDKRNSKTYYQYKHPITGVFIGLGTDKDKAFSAAKVANEALMQEQLNHANRILEAKTPVIKLKGILVSDFCDRYIRMLDGKLEVGNLAPNTHRVKKGLVRTLSSRLGKIRIKEVTVREIALVLQELIDEDKNSQAISLRREWVQVFEWAQHYGEVDPGFNPPKATKVPTYRQKRSRLTIESTKQLLEYIDAHAHSHIKNAVYLAITTGQRVGDIAEMKFSDVHDGHLHVTQQKSGGKTKLAIPLTIKNPLLKENLGEIIKRCRDHVVSQSLVHYSKRIQGGRMGMAVSSRNISGSFTKLVAKAGIEYGNQTPPTFHELRSVAARSYMEVGMDIQSLLGHKSQRVTERYQDNRGEEYTYIKCSSS